jgi:hypothetical protein
MAVSQRYRVVYSEKVTHNRLTAGWPMGQELIEYRVRAQPVYPPGQDSPPQFWTPTPGAQVGFSLVGPDGPAYIVGYEFVLTVGPP